MHNPMKYVNTKVLQYSMKLIKDISILEIVSRQSIIQII